MDLRSRLQTKPPLRDLFLTIPNPYAAEWLARKHYDTLTLDLQHGQLEKKDLVPMLQAIQGGRACTLVRLPWNRPEHIMKALDAGADGLICPMIDTPAEAAAFVRAAKYPPIGNRSFGPFRATVDYEGDYFATANTETVCFAMVETAPAVEHLEAIAATPGLDGLYLGPYDLSVSLGLSKRADFSDPILLSTIDRVLEAAKRNNLFAGIFTVLPEDALALSSKGFDLISCGTEDMIFRWGMEKWNARSIG